MSNTPISSASYALNHEQYTFNNAVGWGNCQGQWKLAREGSWGKRTIIHYLIAIVEFPLIIGRISSIFETVIALYFELGIREKNQIDINREIMRYLEPGQIFNFARTCKELHSQKLTDTITRISPPKDITDDQLRILIEKCPRLIYLDLSNCRQITNDGVAHLAQLPLQHLDLSRCENLTGAGLAHLARMPLQYLNLYGCLNLTDAGMVQLRLAFPNTRIGS